jgi:hypothetical protein
MFSIRNHSGTHKFALKWFVQLWRCCVHTYVRFSFIASCLCCLFRVTMSPALCSAVCFVFGCGPDPEWSIFINNLAFLWLDRLVCTSIDSSSWQKTLELCVWKGHVAVCCNWRYVCRLWMWVLLPFGLQTSRAGDVQGFNAPLFKYCRTYSNARRGVSPEIWCLNVCGCLKFGYEASNRPAPQPIAEPHQGLHRHIAMWYLRCSEVYTTSSVIWLDVSGQSIGPIFKGQEIQKREHKTTEVNWHCIFCEGGGTLSIVYFF